MYTPPTYVLVEQIWFALVIFLLLMCLLQLPSTPSELKLYSADVGICTQVATNKGDVCEGTPVTSILKEQRVTRHGDCPNRMGS